MKQKLWIAGLSVLFLTASCRKNNDAVLPPPSAPTLAINAQFVPAKVKTGPIKIGEHTTATGTLKQLRIGYDFSIGGTLNRSFLRNYYVVVRQKSDTTKIVYQSTVLSNVPATFGLNDFIDEMKEKTEYLVSQYATVQSGANGTIETSVNMEYESPEQSGWVMNIAGQKVIASPYKATIAVTAHPMTTMVTNGMQVEQETLLEVSGNDTAGLKQIAWRIEYADHGAIDTLRANALQVELNGQNITNTGKFVDSLGNPVDSLRSIVLAHRKIFFVFSAGAGQRKITGNNSLKLVFTVDGLGPHAEGDAIRALPLRDDAAAPSGWTFLNKGTSGQQVKLYSSPTAHGSAKSYHFLWTDGSAVNNSGIIDFSSGDWDNSFRLIWNVAPSIFHSRTSSG